jgi:hypothetical protein
MLRRTLIIHVEGLRRKNLIQTSAPSLLRSVEIPLSSCYVKICFVNQEEFILSQYSSHSSLENILLYPGLQISVILPILVIFFPVVTCISLHSRKNVVASKAI